MKLAILNGSPRGQHSNSKRMTDWLLSHGPETLTADTFFLNKIQADYMDALQSYDAYLMVFPLYVDSTPAIVKVFLEKMSRRAEAFQDKPIYFIIHSGFPEMVQNLSLKRYLTYWSTKVMHMSHKGVLIMAGSEALQVAPDGFFGKKIGLIQGLLDTILRGQAFDEDLSYKLSGFYKMNALQRLVYRLNPLKDLYWNQQLKKNDALKEAKAAPYQSNPRSRYPEKIVS